MTRPEVPVGAHQWLHDTAGGGEITVVLQATGLLVSETVVMILEREVRCVGVNALGVAVQWRLELAAAVVPLRSSWQQVRKASLTSPLQGP